MRAFQRATFDSLIAIGIAAAAAARTPRPILHQISRDVASVLDLPDVKDRMQAIGFEPAPTTPEEYDRMQRHLVATFSKVARVAGLRAP